jgi:uncharacterized protein (DUF1501 family)
MRLTRRDLFRSALATGVASLVPNWLTAAGAIGSPGSFDRYLILVELDGGNDGLNMFIPQAGSNLTLYNAARSTIKVPGSEQRTITGLTDLTMNWNLVDGPGNGRFKRLYEGGKMAIIEGVGMPNPNRSHFRGIDIWNSGSDSTTTWSDGWVRNAYAAGAARPPGIVAESILLSRPTSNPTNGSGMRVLSMTNADRFIRDSQGLSTVTPSGTVARQHILGVQNDIVNARTQFETLFSWVPPTLPDTNMEHGSVTLPTFTGDTGTTLFPSGDFGNQCRAAAQLIAAGVGVPMLKIRLGGFDNHAGQYSKHNDLLAQLAHGLTGLHDALVESGKLDQVLIMTYSEFGRRVNQNGSNGTDHGTAAPHIIIGDSTNINGGQYGAQPSLSDLDSRGDLKWQIDYREMYSTALNFLGLPHTIYASTYDPISGLLTT